VTGRTVAVRIGGASDSFVFGGRDDSGDDEREEIRGRTSSNLSYHVKTSLLENMLFVGSFKMIGGCTRC
jgi:hypothetical protein